MVSGSSLFVGGVAALVSADDEGIDSFLLSILRVVLAFVFFASAVVAWRFGGELFGFLSVFTPADSVISVLRGLAVLGAVLDLAVVFLDRADFLPAAEGFGFWGFSFSISLDIPFSVGLSGFSLAITTPFTVMFPFLDQSK
jgi:hypothetical protein